MWYNERNEIAHPAALEAPLDARLLNLCRRFFAMSESYHVVQLPLSFSLFEHTSHDCVCIGKKCSKCDLLLCHGRFSKDAKTKSGLYSYCKACIKAYQDERKETIRQQKKKWREVNREEIKERKKTWHATNRAVILARKDGYRHTHIEDIKAYRAANREDIKAYRAANRERYRLYSQDRRARKLQSGGSYTIAEWEALKARYDHTCLCCGKKEPEIKLTSDHVIPLARQGRNDIDNIQPLCFRCNMRKGTKTTDYRKQGAV